MERQFARIWFRRRYGSYALSKTHSNLQLGETTAHIFAEGVMRELRKRLDRAFRADTAVFSVDGTTPSAGQCVAVSIVVQAIFGGELVSAIVSGTSHWFNRIRLGPDIFDIDLTADQFGTNPILIAQINCLYAGSRVRRAADLKVTTLVRAALLAKRARLWKTHAKLQNQIRIRRGF
jgi:hypothetical protein